MSDTDILVDAADFPPHPETVKMARAMRALTLPEFAEAFQMTLQELLDEVMQGRLPVTTHESVAGPLSAHQDWDVQRYLTFAVVTAADRERWLHTESEVAKRSLARYLFSWVNSPFDLTARLAAGPRPHR